MAFEIERKFLLKNNDWRKDADKGTEYCQGYVFSNGEKSVRIRIAGEKAFITIKSSIGESFTTRYEFEYEIPKDDARTMLDNICTEGKIYKVRHKLKQGDLVWEIDEFKGENEGLIMAEVELDDDKKELLLPDWIGEEVTSDSRYYNSSLAKNPYKNFKA